MATLTKAPWSGAVENMAQEFDVTPLTVLEGAVPSGLRGSLYRNGPARLERHGKRVGHWFDGDGAVLGIHFGTDGAQGVYRFVQTPALNARQEAGGYGTRGLGGPGRNVANTAVLAVHGKLLALWEGGLPYAMDRQSLKTFGADHLGGLTKGQAYSAHPKEDPQSGDIYNFGVQYGRKGTLHLYRSDRTGQVQQKAAIHINELPMVHDFVMAGEYLVFFISPLRLNPLPMLAGLKSYSESLSWDASRGSKVLVVDRKTLRLVASHKAPTFFNWHFGNGAQAEDGNLVIDYVRYDDFAVNQALGEVVNGNITTHAPGYLHRACINPNTGAFVSDERVCDVVCEFPEVDPRQAGRPWRYTYMNLQPTGDIADGWFSAIGRFDHQTGMLEICDCGSRAAMEPIFAPDADDTQKAWILTVVYDAWQHRSEVWVLDASNLEAGPVCRLALPSVVPMGFHGTWAN